MSFYYLASPYSDPILEIMHERYVRARHAAWWCLTHDILVFSPIVHCHPMAVTYQMPRDHGFWQNYDEAMIGGSGGILVLKIDGWNQSKGVNSEIALAHALGKPIKYLAPMKDGYYVSE